MCRYHTYLSERYQYLEAEEESVGCTQVYCYTNIEKIEFLIQIREHVGRRELRQRQAPAKYI